MNISLNHTDINEALTAYVTERINLEGKTVSITMTAGRGANGYSASVELIEPNSVEQNSEEGKAKPVKTEIEEDTAGSEPESSEKGASSGGLFDE